MYVYIYMYIHIYNSVFLPIYLSIHARTHTHIHIYTYLHVYIYIIGFPPAHRLRRYGWHEQALVSLKLTKPVDAGVGRTFAVVIEGGSTAK